MAQKLVELSTRGDQIKQAKEIYGRGSRNYLVGSFTDAADDLGEACKLFEELYGHSANELGLPYLLYAKTLIALSQDENKVIDVPEGEEDADESDEDDEQNEEKPEPSSVDEKNENGDENSKEPDSSTGEHDKEQSTSKSNGSDKEEDDDDKPSSTNGNEAVGIATTTEPADEDNEDDEAAANLQVAWEILELAAKIFERQGESCLTSLAEVYAELGGISFENSHFESAISDYEKALQIQIKLPEDNRRIIAEIHYKIGLAYLMLNKFDSSVKQLKEASELIEQEINEEKSKEDKSEKIDELIKDLEETKQDILAKITEVEETKQQSIDEVRRELSKLIGTDSQVSDGSGPSTSTSASSASASGVPTSSSSSSSTEKPKATDISHLIKRKKPDTPQGDSEVDSSPAKRPAV